MGDAHRAQAQLLPDLQVLVAAVEGLQICVRRVIGGQLFVLCERMGGSPPRRSSIRRWRHRACLCVRACVR
jgi:hypothetical protein